MSRHRHPAKSTARQAARAEMRRIVSRVLVESRVYQSDMSDALGINRIPMRRQYKEIKEDPVPIDLSDILILARCPATAEFARRLLVELLSELDAHQLRAVDLERMAQSPMPEHRERVISIVAPLAKKLGLTTSFTVSTAEVTPA